MTAPVVDQQRGIPEGWAPAEWVQLVNALSRRKLIGGALATALLAACGSGTKSDSTPPASSQSQGIPTIHGNVQIPANPARIVALDFPIVCALFDLGVTIVGKPSYLPDFAAYTKLAKNIELVEDDSGQPDLEKIAALKPDLIIADDWKDPAKQLLPYDHLRAIAPTAVFEWKQAGGNWRAEAALTAEAVGQTAQLNVLKDRYAKRCAEIKSTYAKVLSSTRWDIMDGGDGSIWDLYGPNSSHGRVLVDAGVQLGAGAAQTDGYVQYSNERMDMLTKSDLLFVSQASKAALAGNTIFNGLPAVKAGQVFYSNLFFPASYGIALALLNDVAAACKQLQGGNA